MPSLRLSPDPKDFIWASGIEDTFVPQTRPGQRALDEYELMGHYDHWREDLALARDAGVQALRWGVPWYRVEPAPGQFDWSWTDQVLPYLVHDLGITPILDLMHYGCPFWLSREFDNPAYPQAVAAYAGAFARRYQGLVRWYTPLNEPLVNAMMCGDLGRWPPYLRGDRGYIRVILQLVRGIRSTIEALRAVNPDAVMVHVEAASLRRASDPALAALADEDTLRSYLTFDLLTGRVTPTHPLFTWLLRNGATLGELADIAAHPVPMDVMGLNFYPQWATRELYVAPDGRLRTRIVEKEGSGFEAMIAGYYRRYGVPLMITETSAKGAHGVRKAWLQASIAAVRGLRGRGVPVLGYTWFPLFTMIDWKYRFGKQPVEKYRLELGLYTLESFAPRRWRPTPLAQQFKQYLANPAVVGPLAETAPS